ncbi:DeoR/GlpR family DNA-binding transcription regulator [Telmatospirillum siberiense]|uniref:DeoR family transcriptional regulator n=1 Tax=Telmatospirillum siberiense TaxID=382514 RepID=A0A2N3PZE2_9PROT|nr:DeoR family transcriptional regulator [Telmatospirillum siberiense]PKU25755.1 DeoR family transcriptional regulator [Telmatospirillum siberiense]
MRDLPKPPSLPTAVAALPPGLNRRQANIVQTAQADGFVSIDGLAAALAVTPQTIRRDINMLCEMGLLHRYHGGASLPSSARNIDYQSRRGLMQEEKERIGRLVAQHIPDGASLFLNIGTTTEAVARALLGHRGLRIITNNINVAVQLSQGQDFEITIAGGRLRQDLAVVGEATVEFINQFKVDFGIIGISGIDPDGTLLDFDYREVKVAQAIIANARQIFLATDHTKFGRPAMVKLGHISVLDALFIDRPPAQPFLDILAEEHVCLHVVDPAAPSLA